MKIESVQFPVNDDGTLDIQETIRWARCGNYLIVPQEIREFINELIEEEAQHN